MMKKLLEAWEQFYTRERGKGHRLWSWYSLTDYVLDCIKKK